MFTDTTHLEKVCEHKLQAGVTLDEVIAYLSGQDISILDAIKVVRKAGGMSLGDAKQVVSCHAAWRSVVRGFGGCAATHVEGTAEVLRLAEVFVMLALTSFLWAAQHF